MRGQGMADAGIYLIVGLVTWAVVFGGGNSIFYSGLSGFFADATNPSWAKIGVGIFPFAALLGIFVTFWLYLKGRRNYA